MCSTCEKFSLKMNIFFLCFFLLHNNEIKILTDKKKELFLCETEKNCNFGCSPEEGTQPYGISGSVSADFCNLQHNEKFSNSHWLLEKKIRTYMPRKIICKKILCSNTFLKKA